MAIRFAVFTILSFAACFWTVSMARDPKKWRLLWLDFLTVLDVDTNREQRRVQEGQLRMVSCALLVIFIFSTVSCAFWTFDQVREVQRFKTAPELESENIRRQIERVAKMPRRKQGIGR